LKGAAQQCKHRSEIAKLHPAGACAQNQTDRQEGDDQHPSPEPIIENIQRCQTSSSPTPCLGNALMSVRSVTTRSNRWILLLAWLLGAEAIGANKASEHCLRLQEQRDQWARQAWREEVKLVHKRRLELCPQLENLANQGAEATAKDQSRSELNRLDYGAYARCRRRAEVDLKASQAVLYTNDQNVPFFTVNGAEAARQADALRKAANDACP
jgi:hypothetical protein